MLQEADEVPPAFTEQNDDDMKPETRDMAEPNLERGDESVLLRDTAQQQVESVHDLGLTEAANAMVTQETDEPEFDGSADGFATKKKRQEREEDQRIISQYNACRSGFTIED